MDSSLAVNGAHLGDLFCELLYALHHSAKDILFDETAEMALRYDYPHWNETFRDGFRARSRLSIAESYLARRRYAEALPLYEEGYALFERLRRQGSLAVPKHAPLWYLRAGILNGLGREDDARREYNAALKEFERTPNGEHGAASCLRNLAGFHRRAGFYAEARNAVHRAMQLFEQAYDPSAVTSCQITLGDLHSDEGETAEAERLYRAALSFWQRRDHPRWISICDERLQTLTQTPVSGDNPFNGDA
jgi:tetratricopeptide (TPR) repeat protein